jgi:hypothetical protein
VGAFDRERASGVFLTAQDFHSSAAMPSAPAGQPAPRPLTDEEIQRVRARRGELMSQWHALPPGATLELRWDD